MKAMSAAQEGVPTDTRESLDRLYSELVHALYHRQDRRRARQLAGRLERVLRETDPKAKAIFVEECRSLIQEAKGNLAEAIRHREREIRLIRRLHALTRNTADADFALGQYSYADLSDRLDLLAMLYRANGNLGKAIRTLKKSEKLCAAQGIKFDGGDILQDYLQEQRDSEPSDRCPTKRPASGRRSPNSGPPARPKASARRNSS
jgi:hypothetical protein